MVCRKRQINKKNFVNADSSRKHNDGNFTKISISVFVVKSYMNTVYGKTFEGKTFTVTRRTPFTEKFHRLAVSVIINENNE